MRRIHELVQDGSQFIIATHSPLILAYPDAMIYDCTEAGLQQVDYDDAEPVRLTSNFLNARKGSSKRCSKTRERARPVPGGRKRTRRSADPPRTGRWQTRGLV